MGVEITGFIKRPSNSIKKNIRPNTERKNKIMPQASDQEIRIAEDDFIVSKTDPKGKITYCNRVFMKIAGYQEDELLNQPHNIIRHPDMPRSVFRFMWNTLQEGKEFFGIVKNRTKSGGYYWAFANVTPSYDANNLLLGYYSVRRCPTRESVTAMESLYREMLTEEQKHSSAQKAMDASMELLHKFIEKTGQTYEEFILSHEK